MRKNSIEWNDERKLDKSANVCELAEYILARRPAASDSYRSFFFLEMNRPFESPIMVPPLLTLHP
jgi:hypothetical protein